MSITVEDGSVVSGANSFVSLDDFTTYCENRGRSLDDYDEDTEVLPALIQAADYLNNLNWKGVKTDRDNPMAWPRYGQEVGGSLWNQLEWPASTWVGVLDRDGFYVPTDEVPTEVVNAQCEAAWIILGGSSLEPTLDRGGQIKREKYDVVEFEYFSGAPGTKQFKAIENRLRGLLKSSDTQTIVRA